MTRPVVHIVGAGLAGLAAAVRLIDAHGPAGVEVVVYEAARQAGGRCRSYYDSALGMVIDNGNHLMLSGNRAAMGFLKRVGGLGAVSIPARAEYPFADLATGERWTLRPNAGPIPWWIFVPGRRVPGAGWRAHLGLAALLRGGADRRIDAVMSCEGVAYERLWRPFLLAALNLDPAEGSTRLAGAIVRESLARGGAACRPVVADGLSAALIEPAIAYLAARGAFVRLDHRLRAISFDGERAAALDFGDARAKLGPADQLILATPAPVAQDLLPGLTAPTRHRAILNAHFKLAPPPGAPKILGLVNATAEWIFAFENRISVTVSAADALLEHGREALAERLWADVAKAYALAKPLPSWQVIKEKRATFAATPEENALRPGQDTRFANVTLAGDWTDTGLPATIEGAIRSGERAADLATQALKGQARRAGDGSTAAQESFLENPRKKRGNP
ncbi:hydroxysqualene dehydroxylase HpnE [Methylocella sp.]|uniref:hydroxysqualene dehydroxylase HpnE n=1 Tax=Methylocella sp. TaxID=1978226 RepID=UPI00378446AA